MIYLASHSDTPDTYRHFFYDIESKVICSTFYEKKSHNKVIVTADILYDIATNSICELDDYYTDVEVELPEFNKWVFYQNIESYDLIINRIEQIIFENI